MKRNLTFRYLSLFLALVLCFGLLQPVAAWAAGDEEPGVADYQTFVTLLKVLEGYADQYAASNSKYPAATLVINFIRTGVDRYNDGNWKTLAGEEITEFTAYVEAKAATEGTDVMLLRNIIIEDFKLPNGDQTDFGHMFGTLNIAHIAGTQTADLGGWAGDICDLLRYSKEQGNVPAGTIDEMAAYILENCFGIDAEQAFGMDDFYGDMDAFYLDQQVKAGQKLSTVMEAYFTASLSDSDRAVYFLNNRFKGLETREDVRKAVYDAYKSNVGLQVLEADRGLVNETDLRMASCYAFADYLFNQAGDRLEGDTGDDEPGEGGSDEEEKPMDNEYYSVFSSTNSILAPGIEQTICYATTTDNKQIVYYVATVDVTRDDVTIMANYRNNDPSQGWGMQRVEDQANALLNNYKNKYENFSVVVATNADGYNMSTGQPGGLLVMAGVEWHPVDGSGFFAILKDGTAMIGTQADYATYKEQIQEAVGGFGAVLIKDGEIAVSKSANYVNSRASRTAIGITADGKVVMMVLDGRQEPFSAGGSMEEIAQIMLDAGCVEAINLDGGGSSTYLSKPEGSDSLKLVNRPSDGYARSVATSLVAVSTAKPSNEFDHANISAEYDYLTIGTELQFTAIGVNNVGGAAAMPENVVWQVSDPTVGSVDENGLFRATANGQVAVQLLVDGVVVGEKTVNVVVPDTLFFEKDSITAIYGEPIELPLVASYNGNIVRINKNDVLTRVANRKAGKISFLTFTGSLNTDIRNVAVNAYLAVDNSITAQITVKMFSKDEAYFDFENATAGNYTLAWLREVSNATVENGNLYQIVDVDQNMDINYTFALDMAHIEIPKQLEDITYMLPGADAGSTAWDFLLQLAERISVLSEVTVTVQLDPDLEVDLSGMKIVNEYFELRSVTLDENNLLTICCGWIDQTQAIDAASANPLCIVSGLKATPKDSGWDSANMMTVTNTGAVTYRIFLRASSLYSFACIESNQITYNLYPYDGSLEEFYYNGEPLLHNGAGEKGAYFASTYVDFEDSFKLSGALRQGWWMFNDGLYYYVDNEPLTGLQYLPSYEDPSVKLYYQFDENGMCEGTVNGKIVKEGNVYFALQGVLQKGWQSVLEDNGESFFYYFDPYTYTAVGGGSGWITVEGYQYYFEDYKCLKGSIVETPEGLKYRFAGLWQRNQWVESDGKWYYIDHKYYAKTNGFHWVRNIAATADECHLFGADGVWQQNVYGLYHVGADTYWIEDGIRIQEAGLVYFEGYYYYFAANAKAVKNCTYWPSKTNGLLPVGPYKFDEQGRIVNPPVDTPDPDPNPNPNPDPNPGETPEQPPVKDGIVQENGGYFYYKNGVLQYGAGLIMIGEDYYYIRSNGQAAVGNYWVTNSNGLMPSGMYYFGPDGKMVMEGEKPEDPDPNPGETPEQPPVKDGFVSEYGAIYYYKNGVIQYAAGLIYVDGYYYYVRSNGQLATGEYWPSNTNGLLPEGMYQFDETGKMLNPPTAGGEEPGTPEQPKPEQPPVKEGIVEENGVLYYYENGTRAYAKGVVKLVDENGVDFYIYVRSNAQLATGIYWPTTTNGLLNHQAYDWGTDGRLYL